MPGTFSTDLAVIKAAELVADYLVLGTFASAQALNDDIKVEGTNAINGRVSANSAWSLAATPSADLDLTGTDVHVYMWIRNLTWPSTDTKANGGVGVSISSDVTPTLTGTSPSNGPTNSKTWYLAGSDTETTAGWVAYVVDPNGTPDLTLGTPAINAVDRIGLRAKITGTVSNKTLNIQHDVIRYGTGITTNDGTSGSPVAFTDIFTHDSANARAYGVVTQQAGIYFLAGKLRFGTTGQTAVTYFADTNKVVTYLNFPVAATFYEIKLAGAASFITTFKLGTFSGGLASGGCSVKGAGDPAGSTHAIWTLTADAANTLCLLYGSTFSELKTAALKSDSEVKFCTFQNFGEITAGGATFDNCTFQNLKTTAPISAAYAVKVLTTTATITNCKFINCATALLWDRAADTNGKLNGTTFTSGGTGHAIEFGTNTPGDPTELTLTDVTFSGYGADGTTDAAVYNNSGKHLIINISGGTSPTVRNGASASTTIVAGAVSTTITVKDINTGAAIASARVLVTASDGTGPMPFEKSTSITRSVSTATATVTAHGLISGKQALIKGADQQEYNGVFTVTVTGANTFTYTVSGSPATPATGTIKTTGVVINGVTDGSGVITDSRSHASNQPITGRVRKATGGTLYKTGSVSGTINSSTGFAATVQLIPDQ